MSTAHAHERAEFRTARTHTRRRLHEPRPAPTPESRARVGQWKATIKAAGLAGYISKGGDKYLLELLAIPSVARGTYGLYSDKQMGMRLNTSARTIRRHRKDAADHGLIEVLGHGKDRKPCMVRPILPDGPVFPGPKLAGKTATSGRLTRPILAAELLLTETLKTEEEPPLPPMAEPPAPPAEGGESIVDSTEEIPQPLAVTDPDTFAFHRFWLACDAVKPGSSKTFAWMVWCALAAADKAGIARLIDRDRRIIIPAGCYIGHWLQMRSWKVLLGLPQTAEVFEGSKAWWHCARLMLAEFGKTLAPTTLRGSAFVPPQWVQQFSERERQQHLGRDAELAERAKTLLITRQAATPLTRN